MWKTKATLVTLCNVCPINGLGLFLQFSTCTWHLTETCKRCNCVGNKSTFVVQNKCLRNCFTKLAPTVLLLQMFCDRTFWDKWHHNHLTALFPGPRWWAGARRELLDFMVQGKINRDRHIDHPAGRHSIRTNQCPPGRSDTDIFTGWMPFLSSNQPKVMTMDSQHRQNHESCSGSQSAHEGWGSMTDSHGWC